MLNHKAISFSLDTKLIEKIHAHAKKAGFSKSAYLAIILSHWFGGTRKNGYFIHNSKTAELK